MCNGIWCLRVRWACCSWCRCCAWGQILSQKSGNFRILVCRWWGSYGRGWRRRKRWAGILCRPLFLLFPKFDSSQHGVDDGWWLWRFVDCMVKVIFSKIIFAHKRPGVLSSDGRSNFPKNMKMNQNMINLKTNLHIRIQSDILLMHFSTKISNVFHNR